MRTKNNLLLSLGFLLLLAAGCSPAEPVTTEQEEQEFPVIVQSVEEGSIERHVGFIGRAEANTIVQVTPKISGKINSISVREGAQVSAGQTLMTLDGQSFQDAVKQAEAQVLSAQASLEQTKASHESGIIQAENGALQAEQALRDAQTELDRIQRLYDSGAVPEQQLDQAKTAVTNAELQYKNAIDMLNNSRKTEGITVAEQAVQQAQVSLEIARSNLADVTVTAPQAGIIAELDVEVGEMVSPQQAAMKILNVNPMMVTVNVPESQLSYFELGKELKLYFESIAHETTGVVDYISPLNTAANSGYPVKLRVNNDNGNIKHGMIAQVQLDQLRSESSGLLVPTDAILKIDGKDIVYVIENDRAILKEVTVIEQSSATSIVSGELQAGDTLIIRGHTLLADGAKVRVVEE